MSYLNNNAFQKSLCFWETLCLITMMVGLSLPSPVLGLTTDLTNDPAKTVKKYLSLDKRGARLHASTSEALQPYIAWPHEPAWGHIVIIDQIQVQDDIRLWDVVSAVEAVIPVTFRILGAMQWETATFLSKPRTETMPFRVRAIDNHWKIVEPMLPPHVGKNRLMDHIRLAWLKETDTGRKERLDNLWKTLDNTQ